MRSVFLSGLIVMVAGFCVLTAGCGQSDAKKAPKSPAAPKASEPAKTPEASKATSGPNMEGAKVEAGDKSVPEAIAELPEADRALALKQKICPVSGEALGSMGKPGKLEVKGRTVFICCDGCAASLKKDPDKYLAKLDAAGKK